MPRRIIQPHERGKKPTLNPNEVSKPYYLKMPESLHKWCLEQGPKNIRAILIKHKYKNKLERSNDFLI